MFVETKKEGEQQAGVPQVPSLADMIAWLEMQPPEREYAWFDIEGCLVCAYFRARKVPSTAYKKQGVGWTLYREIFPGKNEAEQLASYHRVGSTWPWTFGAALDRARVLLAEQ